MSYFNSLEIPEEIDNYFKQLQCDISSLVPRRKDFLEERKPFHITFLFFGKDFNLTENKKKLIETSFARLTPEEKILKISHLEFFNTRRDKLLVCKFEMSERLKTLKNELCLSLGLKDKITKYNPHVTLGKIRTENLMPQEIPLEHKTFLVERIKYHD